MNEVALACTGYTTSDRLPFTPLLWVFLVFFLKNIDFWRIWGLWLSKTLSIFSDNISKLWDLGLLLHFYVQVLFQPASTAH